MKRNLINTFTQTNPQVEVTFTKRDGTQRVMICTKQQHLIPEEHQPKGDSTLPENDAIVRVFDREFEGWRSFRIDSVTNLVGMNSDGEILDVVNTFEG